MYNGKFVSFLFSPLIRRSSAAAKIAYVGAFTALSVVSNMFFEFKFYDIQYSLTIFFSAIIGVFLGPLLGFCACFYRLSPKFARAVVYAVGGAFNRDFRLFIGRDFTL